MIDREEYEVNISKVLLVDVVVQDELSTQTSLTIFDSIVNRSPPQDGKVLHHDAHQQQHDGERQPGCDSP